MLAETAGGRRRAHREGAPRPDALRARLRASWRRWRLAPRDVSALVLASRGVWTAAERRAAARRLRGLARRVLVVADVEAAYRGALGDAPGILLLAGTGSIALGRDAGGRWARAGGLGPLAGDEGSAFWIGRQWLIRLDDRRAAPGSPGGPRPARRRARRAGRARRGPTGAATVAGTAALAPRALRAARGGSPAARRIVAEAQRHLAALVGEVARRLRFRSPVAVSWAGGLLADRALRRGVWRAARAGGLCISPRAPAAGGAEATLDLARRLAGPSTPPAPPAPGRPRRARVSRRGAGRPRAARGPTPRGR